MVRRTYTQRTLVEVLLPDADKLWDPVLRQIDLVLEDEELVDQVTAALGRRHPLSARRGRLGTPAAVVLRMLVLKHLSDWSFDECEREVRGSLVYRAFCRIDGERVPDAKTLIRLAHVLDGPVLKRLLERLVAMARQRRVVHGRRLRVDTTVVETTIHYPTDSGLLADGVRVLTRTMKRLTARLGRPGPRPRSGAQRGTPGLRDRATEPHGEAASEPRCGSAASAGCDSSTGGSCGSRGASSGRRSAPSGSVASSPEPAVRELRAQLRATAGLVRRVVAQTRARVLRGDTHYPDKLLSLFEPHTEAIRKGKAVKPTEFGKLVKIQEAEAQFITDYAVCATRVPDQALWVPSLVRHEQLFGRPRAWPWPMVALPPGRMSRPRTTAACARWSCRGNAGTGARAPFEPRSNGGPAAKAASAP